MPDFDLVIIGTGSGNSILGPEFADWNVAIVERGVFGGTCLNVGCIPSKMLVLPADRIVEASEASRRLDVRIGEGTVQWPALRDRIFGRIDPIAANGTDYRKGQSNVTVFQGDGRFVGDHRLEVAMPDGSVATLTAPRFVLAAGARPRIPDIEGLAGVPFHTSDTIMRIDRLPEHLIILGGGFIAAELGHVFAAYGSKVSIVHRAERMLRHEDEEVSRRFSEEYATRVDLYLHAHARKVLHRDGRFVVAVDQAVELLESDDQPRCEELIGDALLVTTGRDPNGDQLDVASTGVELDDDGYVITDSTLETASPGIWALGDIRNPLQLKHLANREAKLVAHNLVHPDARRYLDEFVVPHAVFAHPQVGSVGSTEAELVAARRAYAVGRCDYAGVAYGWALEDTTSFAKVLIDPDDLQLLGAHVIGPQAATLAQQLTQAIQFRIPADRLAREQIWTHPALPEVIENALLDGLEQLGR